MNDDLKKVFKNSGITALIIFAYGLIIGQKSVYIASTLGAILSIVNLYSIYIDDKKAVYSRNASAKGMGSYLKRLIISGVFMVLLLKISLPWFVSGVIGLLVVKFNIILLMLKMQLNDIIKKLKT